MRSIVVLLCLSLSVAGQSTLTVPAQYPTIQSAITAASSGDTVLVDPGTYNEHDIDFSGKAITVRSTGGAGITTVDAQQQSHVFDFHSGEGSSSVLDGFTVTGGQATDHGGIRCHGSGPTITNCVISGNAAESGAGVGCIGGATPVITNCIITGNTAQDNGGGIGVSGSSSVPVITNCTISGNDAVGGGSQGYGGGIFSWSSGSPVITNCLVWGNSQNAGGSDFYIASNGSGVITYSNVGGGFAGTGNIDVDPLLVSAANGDFHLGIGSPCIDSGDTSAPGLPATDFEGDPRIIGASVDMGADEHDPGQYHVPAPYPTIQAAIDAASNGHTVVVAPGTYNENDIDFSGKAITVRSAGGAGVTTVDAQQQGRAFLFDSGEGATSVLDGFTITGGNAEGGGIRCDQSSPTITNCVIMGNIGLNGAGVYLSISSAVITNCVISSNMVDDNGAGIVARGGGQAVITNCTISGNVAGTGGNSTQGFAGGVYSYSGAHPLVTNSLIWGNTQTHGTTDVYVEPNGGATVTYCDVGGGTQPYPGTGNINIDPQFLDAANGDFHLASCASPCIDAGDNSAPNLPSTDFEGDARIIGAAVDIGADEYLPSSTPPPLTFPISGLSLSQVSLDVHMNLSGGAPGAQYFVFYSMDPLNVLAPGMGLIGGLHISIFDLNWQSSSGLAGNPLFGGMLDCQGTRSATAYGAAAFLSGTTWWAIGIRQLTIGGYEPSNIASITF